MEKREWKYGAIPKIDTLDPNTPYGIILSQIKPGSTVLECGCGMGTMTRYMAMKLNCKVYIIEYVESAFQVAMQYAFDGICADLTEGEWEDKYRGITFDHIIFSDVLEHLNDPLKVLKKMARFIKEDGSILASIPNITHNDVLFNMLNGRFTYTNSGLLDDTHIHFWGEKDIVPFFVNAGLRITNFDFSLLATGTTEQRQFYPQAMDMTLLKRLSKRLDGEIYQFVVTAQRAEYVQENHIPCRKKTVRTSVERAELYLPGSGTIRVIRGLYEWPAFHQRFALQGLAAKRLRFNPICECACIVEGFLAIDDGGNVLDAVPQNGIRAGNFDIFTVPNPQYEILCTGSAINYLEIRMQVTPIRDGSIQAAFASLIQAGKASD